MESDVHESKPECYIIDRMEDIGNSDEMALTCSEFSNSANSSLIYSCSNNDANNSNHQDKKCGYCSATFTEQQELISHLKTHTFICIECDQTFFDDKALALHMTNHMSKKKWVCEFCNKVFSFRSLLEQHSRSHLGLKPFKCDRCGKHFSRLFNLKVHKRQHGANGSFDCSHCSRKFTHSSNLSKHLRQAHTNQVTHKCTHCPKEFSDLWSLNQHLNSHKVPEVIHTESSLPCKFCSQTFSTVDDLNQHLQTHADRVNLAPKTYANQVTHKCTHCPQEFSELWSLNQHLNSHKTPEVTHIESSLPCKFCPQTFSTVDDLNQHLQTHADRVNLAPKTYVNHVTHKCTHCPQEFSELWSLNQHLNSHRVPEVTHIESSLPCKFCSQTFSTVDDLNQHLQTHTDRVNLPPKAYSNLSAQNVQSQTHANKVNLPPKTYANLSTQNVHLQSHDKEEQFQCEICSKPFLNLVNLSRHLKCHSKTDNREYFCRLCPNQKFTNAKLLLEHQKSRHYGKLPFVCEYCRKEFMFRSLLMQHLRKHTGEKPFCCPHCQKSFVRLSNMKTHIKKHENRMSQRETIELVPLANFEQQNEIESNNLGWDGSVSLENGSSFRENGQETDSICSISSTLAVCQNVNNEMSGKIQGVTFENLSIEQQSNIYFLDAVNEPTSQYPQEIIPPISPLTSKGIYANETTDENENQVTFQNLPLQSDNIFFPGMENHVVSNGQHSISPEPVKEPAVISVIVADEDDEKHKDLNITFENLPSVHNLDGDNPLDNQPDYDKINQPRLPTPLKELPVIPVTSANNNAYADKSTKDSYVINLETDLSSQIGTGEDVSTSHPFVNDDYVMVEQISTDAVAANNSRILQYLNSQTQELNSIREVDKGNGLLEETTAVNAEISEFSGSELIDLTEEINDTKTNLNFRCSYCGITFLSTELLNDHLKLHTVVKPFVCGYCQKSFRYSSLLTQHIKIHRQQINSFRCGQCPKTFSSRNSLILHQQTHKKFHEKPKKALLDCKDCGQQFHSLQDLCHHKCVTSVNVFPDSYDKSDNVGDDKQGRHTEHLQNKTRKKNNQLHTCGYCGKVFRYLSLLTQHLRRHTGEKPFTCPTCRKSFARLFNLEVHQKQHMKKAQHSSLPSTVHQFHPIKNIVSNPAMIQSLDTAAPFEEILMPAREKTIKISYNCNFCDLSFVTPKDLEKHQQQHNPTTVHQFHPIKNIVSNPVSAMIQPLDTAASSEELLMPAREKTIKIPYNCNFCDLSFITPKDFEKHQQQQQHNPSTVHPLHPIKNIVSNPVSAMIQSLNTAAPSEELLPTAREKIIKISYNCNFCDLSFVTAKDLEIHQQQQHNHSTVHPLHPIKNIVSNPGSALIQPLNTAAPSGELLPTVRTKTIKRKKSYSCNFCDQSFVTRNDLGKHRQQHKPFICEFCKKEFRFHSLLVQHLPTHTGEKAYPCQICQKSFARLFNLKMHQQRCCGKKQSKSIVNSSQK